MPPAIDFFVAGFTEKYKITWGSEFCPGASRWQSDEWNDRVREREREREMSDWGRSVLKETSSGFTGN